MKLTIELVPSSCWYNNVRSNVSKERWDELRFDCYAKANHHCEICGETGKNQGYGHDVECHEIWEYDDDKHIQTLKGLIALCPLCHKVKHFGHSKTQGEEKICFEHLKGVNKWSKRETGWHVDEAFEIHIKRNFYDWTVDLTYLSQHQDQLSSLLAKMNKFRKN